jgi:hypothetical protein
MRKSAVSKYKYWIDRSRRMYSSVAHVEIIAPHRTDSTCGQVQKEQISNLTLQLQSLRQIKDSSTFTEAQWKQYCLAELFVTNPTDDRTLLKRTKGDRSPGICTWITASPIHRSWEDATSSSHLWISGGPGKGKTVISISLTEELEKSWVQGNHRARMVYFFCDNKDDKLKSASCMVRRLILLLLRPQPDLIDYNAP